MIRGITGGLDRLATIAVIIAMTAMVAIVSTQVFLRYGLNASLDWAEEVSRLFFVWTVFLGLPLGIRRGAHVGIDLLTAHLPGLMKGALFRLMSALAMLLMGVVAWQAGFLIRDQWDEPMTTLDISVGLFMLPLLIGAVHAGLHLLLAVLDGPPAKPASP